MKSFLLAAVAAAALSTPVWADVTTVKTIYTSPEETGTEVTWDNTLTIPADQFAEDVNVGDYINVTFASTTDVIEMKANGTWLPGTIKTVLGDNKADTKAYITSDMLNVLKVYGLELCGAKFSVKTVEICNDGFQMPEGAIWGGYFWIDNWNTMDLFKTAFDSYDGERYMDIYLSADNGDNTNYVMNVMTAFDNPEAVWANATSGNLERTATKAIVDLKNINVNESLANVPALLIQSNPESGNPFNITAIVLRDEPTSTIVSTIEADPNAPVAVYNLQGMAVKNNVTMATALDNLPAGIYIINGKKYAVR